MTGRCREKSGEEILEVVRRKQRTELHVAAKRDRDGRSDDEIVKAYHERMAAKRGAK